MGYIEQQIVADVQQPIDDSVEQPVITRSAIGIEVIETHWWMVLLEGVITVIAGLFLLYEPVVTTILQYRYRGNWSSCLVNKNESMNMEFRKKKGGF